MKELTSKERFKLIFEHKNADRIPIYDYPWESTLERWHREGVPKGANLADYFGLEHIAHINLDCTPRFECITIEETNDYKLYTTAWGGTIRELKDGGSSYELVDVKIKTVEDWIEAKKRVSFEADRIPWKLLRENYEKWRTKGYWILPEIFFGFNVTSSWIVGMETLLIALMEEPEWCKDMFRHFMEVNLLLLDRIWDEGYQFDAIWIPDDMGFKNSPFFSVDTYRKMLKPLHKKVVEWAHDRDVKVCLHSCGFVEPFVAEWIDVGFDMLNPLEVKAGMDTLKIKREFGNKLVLNGGVNAQNWDNIELMEEEMNEKIPLLKERGGYIFASDHSVPNSVSVSDFRRIIELARKLGKY